MAWLVSIAVPSNSVAFPVTAYPFTRMSPRALAVPMAVDANATEEKTTKIPVPKHALENMVPPRLLTDLRGEAQPYTTGTKNGDLSI
jgi:hypothetical protein